VRHAQELERRLERNTAELKRVGAEAERQRSEQERADSEWREQLEAAKALARKLDTAWTGATERNRRFEGEAAELRQEREELLGKLAAALREAADSKARISDLESQVNRIAAEFERVTREQGHRGLGHSNSESCVSTEAQTSALRHDLHQQNGHGAAKPDHAQPARESEHARTEPGQNAPRHPGQVQNYNFDLPTGKPARRESSSSRKRLQS